MVITEFILPMLKWPWDNFNANRYRYFSITLYDIDGLVQTCSNSTANALELLQSCTKLLILSFYYDDLGDT